MDTSGVVDIPGPTVRNWVLYGDDGSRTWVYRTPLGRSREVAVQPADIPTIVVEGESAAGRSHRANALACRAGDRKACPSECPLAVIIMDTHEDWVRDNREELVDLARAVEVFIPSRGELADLVGYDEPERAAKQLIDAGVRGGGGQAWSGRCLHLHRRGHERARGGVRGRDAGYDWRRR